MVASLKIAALLLLVALSVDGQATGLPSATSCNSGSETVTWNINADTNVLGGIATSDTTLQGCQATCRNNRTCTGFDWDTNVIAITKCWLTGPWSGLRRTGATGVTHYDIVRTSSCACAPTWSAPIANTNVNGGMDYTAVTTIAECQQKCADAGPTRCYGIDWDSNSVAKSKCWVTPSNGTKRTGLAAGVDHYDATWPDSAACNPATGCILISIDYRSTVAIGDGNFLVVSDDLDKATVFDEVLPCLMPNPNITGNEVCVSYAVANRPGYYVRAAQGFLYVVSQDDFESTRWPENFMDDASFIKKNMGGNKFELRSAIYPKWISVKSGSGVDQALTFSNQQVGVQQFYCTSAPLNDQSFTTDSCPDVWSSISHAKISGTPSDYSSGPNCRKDALLSRDIVGVSAFYNESAMAPDTCYLTMDVNSRLSYDFNYTHYDLWQHAPGYCNRGCIYQWDKQNTPPNGRFTSLYIPTNSEYECQKSCARMQNRTLQCKGITYTSGSCRIVFDSIVSTANVIGPVWILTTKFANCGPCISSLGLINGWTDNAAVATIAVSGIAACRTICVNRKGCVAHEVKNGICYISNITTMTRSLVYTGDTTKHISSLYRSLCGNGCFHNWAFSSGTKIYDGESVIRAVDSTTEISCRMACINEPTCTSCDFDWTNKQCVLGINKPKVNWNVGGNWNHYELSRDSKCEGE